MKKMYTIQITLSEEDIHIEKPKFFLNYLIIFLFSISLIKLFIFTPLFEPKHFLNYFDLSMTALSTFLLSFHVAYIYVMKKKYERDKELLFLSHALLLINNKVDIKKESKEI